MENINKSKILVIAHGEPPSSPLFHRLTQEHGTLVAVDGGLHVCLQYGIEPDLLLGDFDSISPSLIANISKTQKIHTPDQSKSDLEKTLEFLLHTNSHSTEITVCGATGKRVDQTLTNMCILCRYPEKVKFESDTEWSMALLPSSVLKCQPGQLLSLIPIGAPTHNVRTKGLKWELKGATLDKDFVSISNVCLGTSVSVSFTSGNLIACLCKN